tara:strand:- start:171 stop:482 length:312 start_codon:yes stop_codon:yes gene_type:complete
MQHKLEQTADGLVDDLKTMLTNTSKHSSFSGSLSEVKSKLKENPNIKEAFFDILDDNEDEGKIMDIMSELSEGLNDDANVMWRANKSEEKLEHYPTINCISAE